MSLIDRIVEKATNHIKLKSYYLKDYYLDLDYDTNKLDSFKSLPYEFHQDSYQDYDNNIEVIVNLSSIIGTSNSKLGVYSIQYWSEFYDKISFVKLYQNNDYTLNDTLRFLEENKDRCTIEDIPKVILNNNKLIVDEGLHRITLAKGLLLDKYFVKLYYNNNKELAKGLSDGLFTIK